MRHASGFVLLAVLVLMGCTQKQPEASKQPKEPKQKGPSFVAAACAADFSFLPNKVECGSMVVEETRGSNNGRWISFPVVVVRASAAAADRKSDPVIFLHGGPGGSVTAGLADRLKDKEVPMSDDRDWIFFDQRGGKQAHPSLDCGTLGLSDAGLTSDKAVLDAKACGEKLSAAGIDLSQYNTAAIVKDLADLRRALHITSYNLYGVSYGSRVAMGVMQHDPSGLRAVVLDSPWPPEASWTGPLPTLVSRELRQVLSLCAADHDCSARYPDLESRFDALLSSWLSTPPVKNGHHYSAEEMAAYLLDALYDDEGARSLPKTIDQILRGDYSALDKFLVLQSDYNEGQFFTHLCKEEFPFESPDSIEGADGPDPIARATARAARRYFAVCSGFKVGVPDAVENQPVVSDIPTLLISGDIDAGCQAELTDAAVKTLSHGQAFNLPNMTHAPAQRSPCAKRMVAGFYADPYAKIDASCIPGDRPKFPFILEP